MAYVIVSRLAQPWTYNNTVLWQSVESIRY